MSTSYTIIISTKRPHLKLARHLKSHAVKLRFQLPTVCDIVHKEDFGHPKLMRQYLQAMGMMFTGFKSSDPTVVELHEGRKDSFDTSRKPMIIRSHILPGKTIYRPCVFFPNGNIQDLRIFLDHWQDMLVALGKDFNPKKEMRAA